MLKTKEITKNFGSKEVLKGISLAIENGKVTAIVGKNGAGKSTLISLIADYKKIGNGTIEKSTLSVMPDADNLFRDMRGDYFLKFSAKLKNTPISTSDLENLAQKIFLKDDLSKKIKNYSFGMKKKISFLQAYIGDFDTYIFDEPTSGVDVETERAMMDLIVELKHRKKAVLLTSHNIEEVERYSDYVYILDDGVITRQGTINELTEKIGFQENYVIDVEISEQGQLPKILKDNKIMNYHFEGNLLHIDNFSHRQIQSFIKKLFENNLNVKGFWQEKRALREVVFEENKGDNREK